MLALAAPSAGTQALLYIVAVVLFGFGTFAAVAAKSWTIAFVAAGLGVFVCVAAWINLAAS